jgi:hypothetical protein
MPRLPRVNPAIASDFSVVMPGLVSVIEADGLRRFDPRLPPLSSRLFAPGGRISHAERTTALRARGATCRGSARLLHAGAAAAFSYY